MVGTKSGFVGPSKSLGKNKSNGRAILFDAKGIKLLSNLLLMNKEFVKTKRLALCQQVRTQLRAKLQEILPGQTVWIFGSLARQADFNEWSDVDLALETEPEHISHSLLVGELMCALNRDVDVVLLDESRLREKILKEGELWTL